MKKSPEGWLIVRIVELSFQSLSRTIPSRTHNLKF
jgi:hypothetical protein